MEAKGVADRPGLTRDVGANMTVIRAVVRDGKIELAAPPDWPEGTEVVIEPAPRAAPVGVRDEDWPTTPDEVARHLGVMDRVEPFAMTAEDEAEWSAAREARKAFEKAHFDENAERLRGVWE